MEIGQGFSSNLEKRWKNYTEESTAIKVKLSNSLPEGKREKLEFRLKDLEVRLIPQLVEQINVFEYSDL